MNGHWKALIFKWKLLIFGQENCNACETWHPTSELITKYFLSSLVRPCWIPGSLEYRVYVCLGSLAAYKGGDSVRNCLVVFCLVVFFFFSPSNYRHCRVGFSFCGRSETQAGRAVFLFVIVNLSLYLITTFPLHSKSVHHTEDTVLEENTTLHILCAALSILVPLLWASF